MQVYFFQYSAKNFQRPRKSFKFHEKGKFEQLAQRLRTKVSAVSFSLLSIL